MQQEYKTNPTQPAQPTSQATETCPLLRELESITAELFAELAPATVTERTFASLAANATWRMRRCDRIEAKIAETASEKGLDAFEAPDSAAAFANIDRTRAQASANLRRALAELRRLQTERRLRAELLPETVDTSSHGLASYKEIVATLAKDAQRRRAYGKAVSIEDLRNLLDKENAEITKRSQPPAQTGPLVATMNRSQTSVPRQNAPPISTTGSKAAA
jgi:hypothetical protein